MKALKSIYSPLFLVVAIYFVSSEPMGGPSGARSTFDIPDQGLYYGFLVNNSSHFVEIGIASTKDRHEIYPNIILSPLGSSMQKNMRYLASPENIKKAYDLPNKFPLWLKNGRFKVSIRYRDDLVNDRLPGHWKDSFVIFDKEEMEKLPGPFTLEIEDD
jgi:hypothetical protein